MKIESTLGAESINESPSLPMGAEAPAGDFNPVLQSVDTGEKSADGGDEFAALEESFYEWRGGLDVEHPLNRPRFDSVVAETKSFLGIVEKAVESEGHSDPVAFLKDLSGSELETLRVMHSLADPIQIDGLSEEGALNLILPISERRDVDNDGFVETGKAVGWNFPPNNAPQSVHDAWTQSTEGMSFGEKMMVEAMFMPAVIRVEGDGSVTEVDRSEANNPYAKNGFSFSDFIEDRLESIEAFKFHMSSEQYTFQKGILTDFLSRLT